MNGISADSLQIHEFVPESYVNGPGRRSVVWTQGCSLGCPGCFNPKTHSFVGGRLVQVDELFEQILALADHVEGITLIGGEPMQQQNGVRALLRRIQSETDLSVVLFTGFTWDELQSCPNSDDWNSLVDVLIAGRYDARQHLARGLRGSPNKTMHFFSDRYQAKDFDQVPTAEVILNADGDVVLTGIDPMLWP